MIPDDSAVETFHLGLHINQEQSNSKVFTVIGHISGVDPTTNKIKCVIPTWTNDTQTYMETGWIPLGTMKAGNQEGIQILPFGGATVTDLTGQVNNPNAAPEQVLIHVLGQKKAFYVVGVQTFNLQDVPPSGYQDKSGVAAQAGEWLFKHASGNYLYFSNQNTVKLISLTNPSPVLQQQDAPSVLNQKLEIGVQAIGTNASSGGSQPATVNSILTIGNSASDGQTNNANTHESVTSVNQGLASKILSITADSVRGNGRYAINIDANDAELSITITGNNNTYNLNVPDGIVNVVSQTSNIKSDIVNLGTGTMKRILTDVAAQVYNNHTHPDPQGGTTGPPNQPITDSDEAQNANAS